MITIHHLGMSQSDRVVWLMEELQLPYELKWYNRKEDQTAPDEFLALHPAATAPVITDGDQVFTESAVILEHICNRHANGKFTVRPEQNNYETYSYWMYFNNNILGLFLGRMALRAATPGPEAEKIEALLTRREDGYFKYLNQHLAQTPFLAGPEFTCADMMVIFNLTTIPLFGGKRVDNLPHVVDYVNRICARPAYIKAMAIAGPGASA